MDIKKENTTVFSAKPKNTIKEKLDPKNIEDKLKEAFGDKFKTAVEQGKDKVTLSKKAREKAELEAKQAENPDLMFSADVGKNDPNDLATHGKLKDVLKSGAFSFNDKERQTLNQILKS